MIHDIFFNMHMLTLMILIPAIAYTDHQGFLWIRGEKETLDVTMLKRLHLTIWAGLIVMIISGFGLFIPINAYLLTVPAFYFKMGFVVTLVINAFLIGKLMNIASLKPFASLTSEEKLPLFLSGIISTICWIGAFIASKMLWL